MANSTTGQPKLAGKLIKILCAIRLQGTKNAYARQRIRIVFSAILGFVIFCYAMGAAIGLYFVGTTQYAYDVGTVFAFAGPITIVLACLLPTMMSQTIDPSTDPSRYGAMVLPSRAFSLAMTISLAAGPAGSGFCFFLLSPTALWLGAGSWLGVLATLVTLPVLAYSCLLLFRIGLSLFLRFSMAGSKPGKPLTVFWTMVLAALLGSVMIWGKLIVNALSLEKWLAIANFLSWTPLSGPWVWPSLVVQGNWLALAVNLLTTALCLVLLSELWHRLCCKSLIGGQRNPNAAQLVAQYLAHLDDIGSAAKTTSQPANFKILPGMDLWQRFGFSVQTSALLARHFCYFFRDVRTMSQYALLPVLSFMSLFAYGFWDEAGSAVIGWLVAGSLFAGFGLTNSISLDGRAYWLQIASGLDSRKDFFGRLVFNLIVVLSGIFVLLVLPFFVASFFLPVLGNWVWLTDSIIVISSYLATAALSLFGLAHYTVPISKAGKISSGGAAGSASAAGLQMLAWCLLAGLLNLPIYVALGFAAFNGQTSIIWVIGLAALAYGALLITISYRLNLRAYQRNQQMLLTQIRSYPQN